MTCLPTPAVSLSARAPSCESSPASIHWPLSSSEAISRWLSLCTTWFRCLKVCGVTESIPVPSVLRFLAYPLTEIDRRLDVLELLLMGHALRSVDPGAIRPTAHSRVQSGSGIRDRRWAIMTLQRLQGVHNAALLSCKTPEGRRLLLLEHCQHVCAASFPVKTEQTIMPLVQQMEELLEVKQETLSGEVTANGTNPPMRVRLPASAWDSLMAHPQHPESSGLPTGHHPHNSVVSGAASDNNRVSDANFPADDTLNDVQRLMV